MGICVRERERWQKKEGEGKRGRERELDGRKSYAQWGRERETERERWLHPRHCGVP